jgi:hypothetical protein
MTMPGLTASASLSRQNGRYVRERAAFVREPAVLPQGEVCDVGYIGDTSSGLYIVCCDPDRHPMCIAYGIV